MNITEHKKCWKGGIKNKESILGNILYRNKVDEIEKIQVVEIIYHIVSYGFYVL